MFIKENFVILHVIFYMEETLIKLKKFAAFLPNNWLAETIGACYVEAWQTVGGKGADFENQLAPFKVN
ncbi:hypothetical protein ACFQ9Y_16540 [Peribacillus simplex]|uniref:hypothetical protein n=1 Tax=Peribacillus simplex TaxID=1478 RepID=UPI00366EE5F8